MGADTSVVEKKKNPMPQEQKRGPENTKTWKKVKEALNIITGPLETEIYWR